MPRLTRIASAALVLAMLLILGVGGVGFQGLTRIEALTRQMTAANDLAHTCASLEVALREAESARRGYTLSGSKHQLDLHNAAIAKLAAAFHALEMGANARPELRQEIAALGEPVQRRLALFSRMAPSAHNNQKQLTEEGTAVSGEIVRRVDGLRARVLAEVYESRRQRAEAQERSKATLLLAAVMTVPILLAVWLVLLRELRARQKVERGLRDAHTLVDSLMSGTEDAIYSKDLEGRYLSINRAGASVLGRTPEDFIGKTDWELLDVATARQVTASDRKVIDTGQPMHTEERVTTRAGDRIFWSNRVPYRDSTGTVIGMIGISRDATERHRIEEELRAHRQNLETVVLERTLSLSEANERLRQQAEELRELSARLLNAQDEERRRIARELHDTTSQNLAGLVLTLGLVERTAEKLGQAAWEGLNTCRQLAEESMKEIRSLSYLLHPPLLDERGLPSALRWFVEGFSRRTGLKIDLETPENLERLPHAHELTLFRIVQEALSNVQKHSGSTTARVRLVPGPEVSLEVEDEGKGIDVSAFDKIRGAYLGVGIAGMRERVAQLGGTFDISSAGKGTRVRVTLPAS